MTRLEWLGLESTFWDSRLDSSHLLWMTRLESRHLHDSTRLDIVKTRDSTCLTRVTVKWLEKIKLLEVNIFLCFNFIYNLHAFFASWHNVQYVCPGTISDQTHYSLDLYPGLFHQYCICLPFPEFVQPKQVITGLEELTHKLWRPLTKTSFYIHTYTLTMYMAKMIPIQVCSFVKFYLTIFV